MVAVSEVRVRLEAVAPLLRNDVGPDAGQLALGHEAAGLDRDLLGARLISADGREAAAPAIARVIGHPVLQQLLLAIAAVVDGYCLAGRPSRAPDILDACNHPGDERSHSRDGLRPDRDVVDDVAREHSLLNHILGIHRRALSGHGHGFLDGPHAHLGIDRCRERRRQLDALSAHRAKARQGKGHRVDARPQVDDLIEALAVGDHGANLFDQGRAGRFDRDAGQYRARRVFHHTRDAALGERGCGNQQAQKNPGPKARGDVPDHGAFLSPVYELSPRNGTQECIARHGSVVLRCCTSP